MNTKQLIKALSKAVVEKDVENAYREILSIGIPKSTIESPHGTDGVLKNDVHNLIALLEFKYDYDFKALTDQVKVLIQVIYYLKKFEQAGEILPRIIFVGDINECFVIGVKDIEKVVKDLRTWLKDELGIPKAISIRTTRTCDDAVAEAKIFLN